MYISLEANIGVGKSTLLPKLAKIMKMIPVEENLEKDGDFLKALGEFNEDSSKAYELQMTINRYRVGVSDDTRSGSYILERSMLSDIVFATVMYQMGDISESEFKLFSAISEGQLAKNAPDVAVYLACDPKVSYERLRSRGREEESNVTLDYVTQLENAHETILAELCYKLDIALVRLDYTEFQSPEAVADATQRMLNLVHNI